MNVQNKKSVNKSFFGILTFLFFFFACNHAFAQSKFFRDNIANGQEYFEQGTAFHRKALMHFLRADSLDPTHPEVKFKIGICYLSSYNKYQAEEFFKKSYQMSKDVDPDIFYFLGYANQLNYQFDSANYYYQRHKDLLLSAKKQDKMKMEEVQQRLLEVETGKRLIRKPNRVQIENLGPNINGPFADYSPAITSDEDLIMFTSRRNTTLGGNIDPNYDEYYEDIYQSFQFNRQWGVARNIGAPINSYGHDATVNLSSDGQKLLIYLDDKGAGNIYESVNINTKWSVPVKLPSQISSSAHESSACYSNDGKTLYFVSDRDGGYGGSDIYYCTQEPDGDWGKVYNMGANVNTSKDEESPFISFNGKTFYFSSKGHQTMGGFDIFRMDMDSSGKWASPQNIGYPVNTPDDDISFVISANGRHGYYAAVKKEGYGNRDIYRLTFLGKEKRPLALPNEQLLIGFNESFAAISAQLPEAPKAKAKPTGGLTQLKGLITDDRSGNPLDAIITITDHSNGQEVASFKSNAESGKYLVSLSSGKNYGITVKRERYLFHSENFNIPVSEDNIEVVKNIGLKRIEVGNKVVLNNVFYDFNKAIIRSESFSELNLLAKLMDENPDIRIELSSHTDNKGGEKYNLDLSQRRSQAVLDYLVSKGIQKPRLEAKGYGFSQPISSNETEEGRQLNRRTEFKILSK
jgi:outer membrane protein OmpA-like peptidoglycan-associated protein/tetratricopeptide (TPR) repeat protein